MRTAAKANSKKQRAEDLIKYCANLLIQRAEWLRKINVCGAYYTSVPLEHIVVRWQQGVLPEMQWHREAQVRSV